MLLCLSSGTDLKKSRHVLKSLSLCNKVLSYLILSLSRPHPFYLINADRYHRRWGGGGTGGGRGPELGHHKNDFCIKMGSDESYFNCSVSMRGKDTKQCPYTNSLIMKGKARDTVPPGHTVYAILRSLVP